MFSRTCFVVSCVLNIHIHPHADDIPPEHLFPKLHEQTIFLLLYILLLS